MKIVGLIASLFFVFQSIGQKSYYFSEPLPSKNDKVTTAEQIYFGTYKSKTAARSFEISEKGIFIISTTVSSISRETIRESSKYSVRNNHIFGVLENDSIPCVLDGERYFFGVRNKDILIDGDSKNQLTKTGAGKYIINHFEDGLYTPEIMRFEGNKLIFERFSYDLETTLFDTITSQKSVPAEHIELVILSPTKEEFEQLTGNGVFTEGTVYKKKRK